MKQSLEILKQKINGRITLGDEVLAILVGSGENQISTDRAMLHSAFLEMRAICTKLQIKDIIFDLNSITPYSEELESALFRLEASRVLEYYFANDPYYIMEGITPRTDFNEGEQQDIQACASVLKKVLIERKAS